MQTCIPVRSASRALQGPWVMLLATSRIQKPKTNTAMALGLTPPPRSPSNHPMSAAWPMIRTETAIDAAPAAINGLRRPNLLVQRSLMWPTSGCTTRPERGPHSHIILAQACGMPSSCTYGVSRESCRAQPNWIPHATDATRSNCLNGTLALAGGCRALPRWRSASGFAISSARFTHSLSL